MQPKPCAPKTPATYQVRDEELFLEFYRKVFWNRMVPKIPANITPNTLTLLGQLCALLAAVSTGLAVSGATLFFPISAFLIFAYLTFDNIDGAHARRTGQCSPLGEFLDHGLDGVASTAALIITGFILTLDHNPFWFVLLCALGALGFAAIFWEQFRTGLLVIPRFSSTEGLTLIMLYQLVRFFAGAPSWLSFSTDAFTVGTAIVLLAVAGYAGAAIPSIFRAAKKGVAAWELIPLAAILAAQVAFPVLGSSYLVPGITVGLIGAHVTSRLIILRHRGEGGAFLSPVLFLTAAPLILALALPHAWTLLGWTLLSLAVVALDLTKNLFLGGAELCGRQVRARIV